jgi:hypothetical protein
MIVMLLTNVDDEVKCTNEVLSMMMKWETLQIIINLLFQQHFVSGVAFSCNFPQVAEKV